MYFLIRKNFSIPDFLFCFVLMGTRYSLALSREYVWAFFHGICVVLIVDLCVCVCLFWFSLFTEAHRKIHLNISKYFFTVRVTET